MNHGYADLGEVRLHYAEAGDGPLVVLLHGFPEFWYSWRHQLTALAGAGFHAVAPDLRGYNLSSKPAGVASYRLERLTADVEAIVGFFRADRAALVGHDWGGAIAWATAIAHPTLVERLAVVNAPHPGRMEQGFLSPRQLARSWYILFFQAPLLPELAGRAFDFAWVRRALRRGGFSETEVERYVESWLQPGAVAAAINYYRALFRRNPVRLRRLVRQPVECPTLVIWGDRDPYLGRELAETPPEWCSDVRVQRIEDAGHWPHCRQPDHVNELLLAFLAGGPGSAGGDERR